MRKLSLNYYSTISHYYNCDIVTTELIYLRRIIRNKFENYEFLELINYQTVLTGGSEMEVDLDVKEQARRQNCPSENRDRGEQPGRTCCPAPAAAAHTHTHRQQRERDCEACRYCIQCWDPEGGWLLCYLLPLTMQSAATKQTSKLSTCYLHTGTPPNYLRMCVWLDLSACYCHLLVASARYHWCSLSHDIVTMCGWRSIPWYQLIDIIPS